MTTGTVSPKINYLNNRDILKEIHLSKNTYCWYADPAQDHQYDLILPSVKKINQRTLAEARAVRIERVRRDTGLTLTAKQVPNTELVFRIMTWDHVPSVRKKPTKQEQKRRSLQELLEHDTDLVEIEDDPVINVPTDLNRMRVNFPPFEHYRVDQQRVPYCVGRSHWQGDLLQGQFSKDHGAMTRKLAMMFIKLCERYATRSNWRGYTYNEEMRGQALLQLSQIGLQFDESKSQNPFAYYTAAITNSFTRVLNIEKKMQNIRDDVLEMNGLNPSWTRQYSNSSQIKTTSDQPKDESF